MVYTVLNYNKKYFIFLRNVYVKVLSKHVSRLIQVHDAAATVNVYPTEWSVKVRGRSVPALYADVSLVMKFLWFWSLKGIN